MSDYSTSVGWRFPLAFQALIAILRSVSLFFMPECIPSELLPLQESLINDPTAPRWLFQKDRHEEGTQILRLLQTHKGAVDEAALAGTIYEITEP
jgi:hypothetical protein